MSDSFDELTIDPAGGANLPALGNHGAKLWRLQSEGKVARVDEVWVGHDDWCAYLKSKGLECCNCDPEITNAAGVVLE